MNDIIISKLEKLRSEMPEPLFSWPEKRFWEQCVRIWAVDELIAYITEHPLQPALDSAYSFQDHLMCFAYGASNQKVKSVFEISADIISLIIAFIF